MGIPAALEAAVATGTAQSVLGVTDNIGTILVIFGGLVGVTLAHRLWKKFVGRKS